jgi:hypothetical protein
LAEMSNILFMCILTRALFFQCNVIPMFISTALFVIFFFFFIFKLSRLLQKRRTSEEAGITRKRSSEDHNAIERLRQREKKEYIKKCTALISDKRN